MLQMFPLLLVVSGAFSAPTASDVQVQSGVDAQTPGSVFVSPSPMDASRDVVSNANMPANTRGGAWVLSNPGGVNGDNRGQPITGSVPPVNVQSVGTGASGTRVSSSGSANANPAVVSDAASNASPAVVSSGVAVDRQISSAGDQTAMVSTDVNNQQHNQSFQVGEGPIVAILPAGSNLTATWNTSSNARPTVGFASLVTPQMVLLESSSEASVAPVVLVSSSTEASVLKSDAAAVVPVILPVGVTDTSDHSAAAQQKTVAVNTALVPVGGAGSNVVANVANSPAGSEPIIMQNHRFELALLDFQLNRTDGQALNQNIAVYVKLTIGALPPAMAIALNQTRADQTPVEASKPVLVEPETSSGLQQVFNGTYATSLNNKIAVTRTITQDLCGQIPDKALLEITVKPRTSADAGSNFPDQQYTCVINMNFPTATRSTESSWSDIHQCNSDNLVNGFSHRLWYQVRQYNIDWAICQQNRPN